MDVYWAKEIGKDKHYSHDFVKMSQIMQEAILCLM